MQPENKVAVFLQSTAPDYFCRSCLAISVGLSVREVKIGLLRLAYFHGRRYYDSACERCASCGMLTAVVRMCRLRRVA
jgi:hypothetical protein